MLSRTVLLCFSLMLGACPAAFSMENPDQIKDGQTIAFHIPAILSSQQEMVAYGELFAQALQDNDYQLIFDLADPQPTIIGVHTHSDIESYLFNRTLALSLAYKDLAIKSELNPKTTIKHYVSIVKEISNYLKDYGNFQSQVQAFNDRMLWHRFFIYDEVGEAYYSISTLKNSNNHTTEQLAAPLKNGMVAYENALLYANQFMKLPSLPKTKDLISDRVPRAEFSLISVYCSLTQLVSPQEAAALLKKSRQIYHRAKSRWGKNLLEAASSTIETAQKMIARKKMSLAPKATKKVEAIRTQNYLKIQSEIADSANKLSSQVPTSENLSSIVQKKNMSLDLLCSSEIKAYEQVSPKIIGGLVEIEMVVANHLKMVPSSNLSREQLAVVYKHLPVLLTPQEMLETFWKYIPAFIYTNDLEGGIYRADLLKEVETTEKGASSYLIRFIAAAMKNLQGDHDEWLSLEAELNAEAQGLREQKQKLKQAAKEKGEQQMLEALRLSLTDKKKPKPVEVVVSKQARLVVQAEKKSVENEPDAPIIDDNCISHKETKLEKQKRHEEAELRRQQDEKSPKANIEPNLPQSNTNTAILSKEIQLEVILASSDKTLSEVYNLSSLPLKIDQEIEQGTWRFTREQFQVYLEAMGCVYKSGHGVHAKVSLPKAMLVTQGDNLITILNDFGGALTLPLWDKDYVPVYLRKQILAARKNLIALKIKALSHEGVF